MKATWMNSIHDDVHYHVSRRNVLIRIALRRHTMFTWFTWDTTRNDLETRSRTKTRLHHLLSTLSEPNKSSRTTFLRSSTECTAACWRFSRFHRFSTSSCTRTEAQPTWPHTSDTFKRFTTRWRGSVMSWNRERRPGNRWRLFASFTSPPAGQRRARKSVSSIRRTWRLPNMDSSASPSYHRRKPACKAPGRRWRTIATSGGCWDMWLVLRMSEKYTWTHLEKFLTRSL